MPVIELGELDRAGGHFAFDHATAAALRRSGLVDVEPVGDRWAVAARGRVGAASVADTDLIVSPKDGVPISRVLFLLSYAKRPGFLDDFWASATHADTLPEALAEAFGRAASHALALGPLQGYVTRSDELVTVRGRIDASEQMRRRQGLLFPTSVSYDDYSVDIAENQILKGAALAIAASPRVGTSSRKTLHHVVTRLEGVTPTRVGGQVPSWRPTRLNHRYRLALHLAELVLGRMSLDVGTDAGRSLAAFAVNMDAVFEDFLGAALQHSARRLGVRLDLQHHSHLDHDRAVTIIPDIVRFEGGRVTAIVDAKYKQARDEGARNYDVYQMLAYCTALGVKEAWLVHAGGRADAGEFQPIRVRGTDVTVRQWSLDLTAAPKEVLEQVDTLADRAFAPKNAPG